MSSDGNSEIGSGTRRKVLKLAGGSVGSVVAVSGLVSASDSTDEEVSSDSASDSTDEEVSPDSISVGVCVVTDVTVPIFNSCDSTQYSTTAPAGQSGQVASICTNLNRVGIEWEHPSLPNGYVPIGDLSFC